MLQIETIDQALGNPVENLSLSRNTIRRTRRENREAISEADKASLTIDDPVLLHWDRKLLPEIAGDNSKVDQVAILVSGSGTEKI